MSTSADRLPEYERALVGACRQDPNIMDAHAIRPEDIHDPTGSRVLSAIRRITDSGRKVDHLSLVDELHGRDVPMSYLLDLPEVTTANAGFYVEKIREAAQLRRIRTFALTVAEIAARQDLDSTEAMDFIERALDTVTDTQRSANVWLKDVLQPAVEAIVNRIQHPAGYSGISSGYQELDELTDGFQAGDLCVFAARPSLGKTALAVHLAVNMSARASAGIVCGFFSSEMSDVLIAQRFLANSGGFDLRRMRGGVMVQSDVSRLYDAANTLYRETVLLNATPNIKLVDLRGAARSMVRRGARILFVDYLTLIAHGDPRTPRHERVGEVSKSLKGLARELSVPVIVLSQLARTAEGKEPSLSELRQSGEIEEDADLVGLLHRERKDLSAAVPMRLIVAKNRNGPTGEIAMTFHPASGRFETAQRGHT